MGRKSDDNDATLNENSVAKIMTTISKTSSQNNYYYDITSFFDHHQKTINNYNGDNTATQAIPEEEADSRSRLRSRKKRQVVETLIGMGVLGMLNRWRNKSKRKGIKQNQLINKNYEEQVKKQKILTISNTSKQQQRGSESRRRTASTGLRHRSDVHHSRRGRRRPDSGRRLGR
jgi:hypothetical protein